MFRLSIVTPEKPFYEADCRSLVAPGSEGYLGVLTDHAPLITALAPGELKVTDAHDAELHFCISGGFFEVSHNHATVLADAIERIQDIDIERARRALAKARELLKERPHGADLVAAELAYLRAKNRLEVASHRT
jgi:F-type H+-transporting ATPase subunit epsilon